MTMYSERYIIILNDTELGGPPTMHGPDTRHSNLILEFSMTHGIQQKYAWVLLNILS